MNRKYSSLRAELADFLRVVIIALSVAVVLVAMTAGLSASGFLYALGQFLILAFLWPGLHKPVIARRLKTFLGSLGIVMLLGAAAWRITHSSTPALGSITVEPGGKRPRLVNRLVLEEDGIGIAARLLTLIGGITLREYEGLNPALHEHYRSMRKEQGPFPTPLIATFMGMQRQSAYDHIELRYEVPGTKRALVFLHGTAGNWSLLCWLVSKMAQEGGIGTTVCPSVGPLGNWMSQAGEKTLLSTVKKLSAEQFEEIYLAGLSSGAVGAGFLAQRHSESFKGAILLFGIYPGLERIGKPVLVLYGTKDERFKQSIIFQFLPPNFETVPGLKVHGIEGDHLAILKKRDAVAPLVSEWLSR